MPNPRTLPLLLVAGLLTPSWARGAPEPAPEAKVAAQDFSAFATARRGFCLGQPGTIDPPVEIAAGGKKYRLHGDRLEQVDHDGDKILRIGVISATKDDRDPTIEAVKTLIARLKKRRIDVLVVNGDVATHEINMDERIFSTLARSGVLTVVVIGNTESCGQFNDAARKIFETYPSFINGNWVRQIELDDGVLYTLPGYFDRRFTHTGGAAKYDAEDLLELTRRIQNGPGPKILVSHGPPHMKGRHAIDIASGGAGHVGDEAMTTLIKDAGVPFGIFGHILEAGGRGSDLDGHRKRREKRWYRSLYVNAGTANPDPWMMLDGSTGWGMGLYVEVKGRKARYQVLELRSPR